MPCHVRGARESIGVSFPAVMSFNANSPPHTELLKLWDVSLVLGLHVHLVFAVARMCTMRDRLFASPKYVYMFLSTAVPDIKPESGVFNP